MQDVHMNAEAQKNIASFMGLLIDENAVDVIGVEGAFSSFDFSRFDRFPNNAVKENIADSFVTRHLISAPGLIGLKRGKYPLMIGIG